MIGAAAAAFDAEGNLYAGCYGSVRACMRAARGAGTHPYPTPTRGKRGLSFRLEGKSIRRRLGRFRGPQAQVESFRLAQRSRRARSRRAFNIRPPCSSTNQMISSSLIVVLFATLAAVAVAQSQSTHTEAVRLCERSPMALTHRKRWHSERTVYFSLQTMGTSRKGFRNRLLVRHDALTHNHGGNPQS